MFCYDPRFKGPIVYFVWHVYFDARGDGARDAGYRRYAKRISSYSITAALKVQACRGPPAAGTPVQGREFPTLGVIRGRDR